MPKNVTVYRVFIGSPGGLEAERRRFRDVLDKFNRVVARRHDVEFEPVGWEDTLPGVGRPQAQINADLELCDYAVFTFHDRWGSRTGNGDLVGTEEEWQIAQRLYSAEGGYQIRQIALYFKDVPVAQLKDPGDELRKVLAFKERVFGEKQHLCGAIDNAEAFADRVEHHLSEWLAKHVKPIAEAAFAGVSKASENPANPKVPAFKPDFEFWFGEFEKVANEVVPDPAVALTFLEKALSTAGTGEQQASALYNKGVALGLLDRSAEEIAVHDDLIARFGSSEAVMLKKLVAMALVNKGATLGALDRSADEIAIYNELIARFGKSEVPALQEQVAKAMFNKGVRLGALDHITEAIVVYDDLIVRFGSSETAVLQQPLAMALFNKSCAFAQLGRISDCIGALDQWAERRGGFDCEKVAYDSDFDGIRQRPKFVRYLKSKGCVI